MLWRGDLTDRASLTACLGGAKPEIIFHLAGTTEGRWLDSEFKRVDQSIAINLQGTLNIVQAMQSAEMNPPRAFVRTGGMEEYGPGTIPYVETQREQPVSPYSA